MQSSTEIIKNRLNVVDVVGGYVKLEKSGIHWKALCPFHREKSPSFMVNEERQMWHCFGCNKGGDIFAFIMEIEGMEFKEALRLLADRAGVELPQFHGSRESVSETRDVKERLFDQLELATKFYEKQLWDGEGKNRILPYLFDRGLTEESIRLFRLGYAPEGWRHAYDFLVKSGFSGAETEQSGMTIRKEGGNGYYDRFRDRIMFPITDVLGRVIGYSARVAPGGDESQAKYINTPETPLYRKSQVLYGLSQARQMIKEKGYSVIVEGNMDVIACHQAGMTNTVAVSGTALTSEQLSILKRYAKETRLFFDMDQAGQKAARRSTELALEQDMNVSIIAIPHGKDAADSAKENPEELVRSIEHPMPALEYFLRATVKQFNPETAQGKKSIVEAYSELLSYAKSPIEQAHWGKILAETLGMEEKLVHGVLHSARVEHEKSKQNLPQAGDPFSDRPITLYNRRSDRLREEVVALLFSDSLARKKFRQSHQDSFSFLETHPLAFFLFQSSGETDPIDMIEVKELKSEASRLVFRVLEQPEIAALSGEDRSERIYALAVEYIEALKKELSQVDRLKALETEMAQARRSGDRETEKKLLTEFMRVSQEKH